MLPAPLLTDPPFVLALLWLARAVGRRLAGPLPEPLAFAVGLGVLPFGFFFLGLLGQARPLPLLLFLLALALGSWRELRAPLTGLRLPREPLEWCLALAVLAYLPHAAAPVTDHDGQFYHLTIPKRWLATGHLDYLPTLTMSQWPLGVDLLYGLCLALWSDTSAKLLHAALGALTLLALAALGERLGQRRAGLLAGALLLALARGEFAAAYTDLGMAFQTAAALLASVDAAVSRERRLWWVAGLLSGFAASVKLTGLGLGLAIAALAPGRSLRERRNFLGIALVPALPYFLRSWYLTGNPLYPGLAFLFPTRDWSPLLSTAFFRFHALHNWGSHLNWSDALRNAVRLALTLLALLGAALSARTPYRLGPIVGLLLAGTLFLTGPYPRYLIPFLPLAVLLLALRLRRPRWAEAVACLVLIGVALEPLRALPRVLPVALGDRTARERYLNQTLSLYAVLVWLNHTTPPDSRFLLVADTAYYSDRPCWLPHPYLQGALRLTHYDDFAADVAAAGLTHVIVGREIAPDVPVRFSQRLARERGTLLFQNAELEVWRLTPP